MKVTITMDDGIQYSAEFNLPPKFPDHGCDENHKPKFVNRLFWWIGEGVGNLIRDFVYSKPDITEQLPEVQSPPSPEGPF